MNKRTEIIETATDNLKRMSGLKNISFNEASGKGQDFTLKINGVSFPVITSGNVLKVNYLSLKERIIGVTAKGKHSVILVAGYISPALVPDLFNDGLNYLDKSGNCHIAAKGLLLHVSGQKQTKEKLPTGMAFNESGLKLISYFLADGDHVGKPYREISAATGLSLGTIKNVIDDLKRSKFVFMAENKRRLMSVDTLSNHWQLAYNTVLKPKLLLGRMDFVRQQDAENWMNAALLQGDEWGGEAAASLLDGFLKPEVLTLYSSNNVSEIARGMKLKPSKNGRVLVFRKFWNDQDNCLTAPRHIVCADLMGSGDSRCLEAAKRLIKK